MTDRRKAHNRRLLERGIIAVLAGLLVFASILGYQRSLSGQAQLSCCTSKNSQNVSGAVTSTQYAAVIQVDNTTWPSVSVCNSLATCYHGCAPGGLQAGAFLRIVGNSSQSIVPQKLIARLSANCAGGAQSAYLGNSSEDPNGWISFTYPDGAVVGNYTFSIAYSGEVYSFQAWSYPESTNCIVLQIPSGNVTSTVLNTPTVPNQLGEVCHSIG